jgi:hypothetical protein
MRKTPSPTGNNGRSDAGRFAVGNSFGAGNPHKSRVQKLRTALLESVNEDDIRDIAKGLIQAAKGGDVRAAQLLLDRTIGKPDPAGDDTVAEGRQRVLSMLQDKTNASA